MRGFQQPQHGPWKRSEELHRFAADFEIEVWTEEKLRALSA